MKQIVHTAWLLPGGKRETCCGLKLGKGVVCSGNRWNCVKCRRAIDKDSGYEDPDLEIRYLRRELAAWRGHCRCPQRTGGVMRPPLVKRKHETRPLCSQCQKPRKR